MLQLWIPKHSTQGELSLAAPCNPRGKTRGHKASFIGPLGRGELGLQR